MARYCIDKLCHPERSIAMGIINRNAQSRDLLFRSIKNPCNSAHLIAGMTNDLRRRLYEHRNDLIDGFSNQYRYHPPGFTTNHSDDRGETPQEVKELELPA